MTRAPRPPPLTSFGSPPVYAKLSASLRDHARGPFFEMSLHAVKKRYEDKIVSSIAHLPGALPFRPLPSDTTPAKVEGAASALVKLLESNTLDVQIFTSDAYWRDQFSLTHNLRTFSTSEGICDAWKDVAHSANVHSAQVIPGSPSLQPTWATVAFKFYAFLSGAEAECGGLL